MRPACFVRKSPFTPSHGFGRVVIMTVDAAESGTGGADAGGQKGDVFFFMAFSQELFHDCFFQVKDLIGCRYFDNRNFLPESVHDNHGAFFGNAGDDQSVKAGVLQIGSEMTSKIGNAPECVLTATGKSPCIYSFPETVECRPAAPEKKSADFPDHKRWPVK